MKWPTLNQGYPMILMFVINIIIQMKEIKLIINKKIKINSKNLDYFIFISFFLILEP